MFTKTFVTILLASTLVNAADTPPTGILANANRAVDSARTAVDQYWQSASNAYTKVFSGRIDAGMARLSGMAAGFSGNSADFEAAKAERNELATMRRTAGKAAKDSLDAANSAVSDFGTASADAFNAAATKTIDAAQTGNLLRQINDGSKLTWSMNKLWAKYNDASETMRLVEKQLDDSVLNAYLQQKVARILSSDNLCTATKSCADNKGKNKATFNMENLKDIFPNSGEYIRKAGGTKAQGGTN